jgi:hypothetical protein
MPNHPGHIEEPQVQGDPKKPTTDQIGTWSYMYSTGEYDVESAVATYSNIYGEFDKEVLNNLRSFWEEEDKKKSQDDTPSDSSLEGGSGVSTSPTDQDQGTDGGVSAGDLNEIAFGSRNAPDPNISYIPPVDVSTISKEAFVAQFGPSSNASLYPDVWQIDPTTLIRDGVDNKLMDQMEFMEGDLFDRYFIQLMEDENIRKGFEQYMMTDGEFANTFNIVLSSPMPLIAIQQPIMEAFAKINSAIEAADGQPAWDADDPEIISGRFADKPDEGLVVSEENKWNTFLRDAVMAQLPDHIKSDEQLLKNLEFHFKVGRNYMFDFNDDRIVGDKDFWGWEGDLVRRAKIGGIGFAQVNAWWGVNVMATLGDFVGWAFGLDDPDDEWYSDYSHDIYGNPQEPVPGKRGRYYPTYEYHSWGDKVKGDNAIAREDVVGKRARQLRAEVNSNIDSYSKNLWTFISSGGTDLDAAERCVEQFFGTTVEFAPMIATAVGTGILTRSPKATAFVMATMGTFYDAEQIATDTSFDWFVDKETNEYLGKDEAIQVLLDKGIIEPGMSRGQIEMTLGEHYNIDTGNLARGWFLGSTWATSYIADRVTFGIFGKAAMGNPAVVGSKQWVKNMLWGMGVSIPQSSLAMFPDMFNRNIQRIMATKGYEEVDFGDAAFEAFDQTLLMMPLAPLMSFAGSGYAYTKNIAMDSFGYNGRTYKQHQDIRALQEKADNTSIPLSDRLSYYRLLNQKKKALSDSQREATDFYDWIARQGDDGAASIDALAHLSHSIDYYVRQLKNLPMVEVKGPDGQPVLNADGTPKKVVDPNLKMLYKEELNRLETARLELEAQWRNSYETWLKGSAAAVRQKKGEYTDADGNTVKYDIEVTLTSAKNSLKGQGVKNPTERQVALEQQRLIDIEMRKTPNWVVDNINNKKPTALTKESLLKILQSDKHAILTAENPQGKPQGEGFNADANKAAIAWLKSEGLTFHEVTGKYGSGENSFIVENMSVAQAKAFAKIFGQHSVAYGNKGLIKSDGSILPYTGKRNMKVDHTKADADFFTSVKLADGTVVSFSRSTAKNGTTSDGTKVDSDTFFETGSKNFLLEASRNIISDAAAIRSLEAGNAKGKNQDGSYSKKQIESKKAQLWADFLNRKRPGKDVGTDPQMTPGTREWARLMADAEVFFGQLDVLPGKKPGELASSNGDGGNRGPIIPNKTPVVTPQAPISTNSIIRFMRNWLPTPLKSIADWRGRGLKIWKRLETDAAKSGEIMRQQVRNLKAESLVLQGDLTLLDIIFETSKHDASGRRLSKKEFNIRKKQINKYLSGDPDAHVNFLTKDQITTLNSLRGRIDGFTQRVIDLLAQNPTPGNMRLIEILQANKGQYMKRSYEAFTDGGQWLKEISKPLSKMKKKYRDLYNDAVEFIMNEQGIIRAEAERVVTDYIDDIVNRKSGENPVWRQGSGALGAVDSKMFAGRKDIPEPFRRLLGEIEDPFLNYANTAHRLASYVSDITYQNILRQNFIDAGWARTKENKIQGDVELAKGESWKGLEGLWVDKGFKQVYDDAAPVGATQSWFWRKFLGLQGRIKIGLTVYSPGTASRNLIGGNWLAMANGHFFVTNPSKFLDTVRLAWGLDPKERAKGSRLAAEEKDLTSRGVVGDSARAGEMVAILNEWSRKSALVKEAEAYGGKRLKKAIADLDAVTQKIYAFGDDFYKVAGYYIERQRFIDSGMDPVKAADRAAERVRGGYPTYSYVSRNVQFVRRNPLVGMFVAFPHEVVRTQANQLKFIAEDLYEGRSKMAMQRFLGMSAGYATLSASYQGSKLLLGLSEDEEKALQHVLPDHAKGSQLTLVNVSDVDGSVTFIDNSTIVPQEYIMRQIRTIMGDGSVDDKTKGDRIMSVIKDFTAPFTGLDATTETVFKIIINSQEVGADRPIYYQDPNKNFLENLMDSDNLNKLLNYLNKEIGPGGAKSLQELFRANNIAPEIFGGSKNKWKEYTNQEAILALLGIRLQTFRPGESVAGGIYDGREIYNNHKKHHTSTSELAKMNLMESEEIRELGYEIADLMVQTSNDTQTLFNALMALPDYSPEDNPNKRTDDYKITLYKANIPEDEVTHYFDNYASGVRDPWNGFFDADGNIVGKGRLETIKNEFDRIYDGPEHLRQKEWEKTANSISMLNNYIQIRFMEHYNITEEEFQKLLNNE